jgi:GNAT superfamily N-acetyltransferase
MIRIRPMTVADVPLGLCLSGQAGWNQTESDWRRALDLQADGCFVAEANGTPAGTTTTCIFGDTAWIAMVLVHETMRGRGIGTALMRHALAFLDDRGIATVRLDATPLGQPIYERLGFTVEFRLARYEGALPPAPAVDGLEPVMPKQWEALAAFDRAATGIDRRALLLRLFAEQPDNVRCTRNGSATIGYIAARAGRQAVQLGPCIAPPDCCPRLFVDAWVRHGGNRVYVDIPVANPTAMRLAEAQGLTVQRHLTRMSRGKPRPERLEWLCASFGPEKG